MRYSPHFLFLVFLSPHIGHVGATASEIAINERGYFESSTLNVMVFDDYYPEGHQGGVSIIQHGSRIATNGDIRLSRDPGQWQPVPAKVDREVDKENQRIATNLKFPNESKTLQGFNPMPDPGLNFTYRIEVIGIKDGVRIKVHLNESVPKSLIGKLRFNLEIFPTLVFGKSFILDDNTGYFPRQANGALSPDENGRLEIEALATGHHLTIAPEDELNCLTIISKEEEMELLDGRGRHNNGWFVLSSKIPEGLTHDALQWDIIGHPSDKWTPPTTLLLSQIGYHPKQDKFAYIECPKTADPTSQSAVLERFDAENGWKVILEQNPRLWGQFLRYQYGIFDFSSIEKPGLYRLRYGDEISHAFQISESIYERHVWQPTVEYFLPVQMCHMRVNEKYRVWHDLCHEDDALMAPVNINHFDGYKQGPETLTDFKPFDPVPNLDVGGWHDAGDYDLRVESQAGTVYTLALAYELFHPDIDQTSIDQRSKIVEIHQPDNQNDILQQIEHGLLTILNGYKSLGRLYRGIITPSLRQYVLLGDASAMTDGIVHKNTDPEANKDGVWYMKVTNSQTVQMDPHELELGFEHIETGLDDRLVFTEENPYRSLEVAAALACAARVMKETHAELSNRSLSTAIALWDIYSESDDERLWPSKAKAAAELLKTTNSTIYREFFLKHQEPILANFLRSGQSVAVAVPLLKTPSFTTAATLAAQQFVTELSELQGQTPFAVPYKPNIWGDGWKIQKFGVQQYFLHKTWPELFPKENLFRALNFILGCHPGPNGASFVSGVGANSVLTAYGVNRADWSYTPGGSISGTALIRPDFPELLEWPYLWQQTEYVLGGGATNFMFLVLATEELLSE